MTTTNHTPQDDELPDEIDFSDGVRGKFYQSDLTLNLPGYRNTDGESFISPDRPSGK